VTTREELHKAIDELPEWELEPLVEFLTSLLAGLRDSGPDDDQSGGAEREAESDGCRRPRPERERRRAAAALGTCFGAIVALAPAPNSPD
jgi:hypothetical protein